MVFSGILFHLKLALIRIYVTFPAAQGLTLKFVKKIATKGFFFNLKSSSMP